MTKDYTPTEARLRSIRHGWATSTPGDYVQNAAEFDRWLAQIKVEALREAANAMPGSTSRDPIDPYDRAAEWLALRAMSIEEADDDRP